MKRRTMASIAAELGLSRTAVSLVLKGEGGRYRISRETQARVRELSERLEYRPSALATALATGRTGVLGLVFPNVYENFMSEIVRGVEEVLHRAGAVMMLCTSGFDPEQELRNLRALVDRSVDALIFVPYAPFRGEPFDPEAPFAILRAAGIPTVCVDRVPPGWDGRAVVQDDRAAAARAVARLATGANGAPGARRIAFVSFDLRCSSVEERRAGWLQGLSGLGSGESLEIRLGDNDPEAVELRAAMERLLRRPKGERPDAWLVATSGLAFRVREIATSLGEEPIVAKFGLDAGHSPSGMICIRQPHQEMGRAAAEEALALASAGGASGAGAAGEGPRVRVLEASFA